MRTRSILVCVLAACCAMATSWAQEITLLPSMGAAEGYQIFP